MVDLAYEFINMSNRALYTTAFVVGLGWGAITDICMYPVKNKDVFYGINDYRIKSLAGKFIPPTIVHGLLHTSSGMGVLLDLDPVKNIYNAFLAGIVVEECAVRVNMKEAKNKLENVYGAVRNLIEKDRQ